MINDKPSLTITRPGSAKAPENPIRLIGGPTPRVEIDLPTLARQKNLPLTIVAQHAVALVVNHIRANNERRIDIHCGDPNTKHLFRLTPEARQARNYVTDLKSPITRQTIEDQTGETIKVTTFNDPLSGNPVVSYIVV